MAMQESAADAVRVEQATEQRRLAEAKRLWRKAAGSVIRPLQSGQTGRALERMAGPVIV